MDEVISGETKSDLKQDMRLDNIEARVDKLEEATTALLQSNAALMATSEQTNKMLQEGFDLMKKLAVGIVGILGSVFGVTQVM